MKIQEINELYLMGDCSKNEYIDKMHEMHKIIYEYSKYIKSTDIKQIMIEDDVVVMTTRSSGIKLICDYDDKRIIPIEILNFGEYEKDVFDMMSLLINENDCIFDIGGNVGWYALNLAKIRPSSQIHTFEPIPKTYNYLVRNLKNNNLNNVIAYNHGFSNVETKIDFYYSSALSGNASMVNVSGNNNIEIIQSNVFILDDFVKKNELKVDFIKCDVEGGEYNVFRGAIDTIISQKPIVFSELLRKWSREFGYHPNDVIELYKELGYGCFVSKENELKQIEYVDEQTEETNFYFLHLQVHNNNLTKINGSQK
jgi:FkbM family methyltransferase